MPGLLLVAFGAFLLLNRIDVFLFEWELILPGMAFIIGIAMWANCLKSETKCKVFQGTLLIVLGGFFFLWNYETIDLMLFDYWPIFPTAFGLAFVSLFVTNWKRWWALIPGFFLLFIGGSFFAYFLGYIDEYQLEDMFYSFDDMIDKGWDYYPVIFVFIGIILIYTSLKRSKVKQETISE